MNVNQSKSKQIPPMLVASKDQSLPNIVPREAPRRKMKANLAVGLRRRQQTGNFLLVVILVEQLQKPLRGRALKLKC